MARSPRSFAALGLAEAAARLLSSGPLEPPIRAVLFGAARFAEHGRSLAREQAVAGPHERRGSSFFPRLQENLQVLREARQLLEEHARQGHHLAPAAGWLIDHGTLLEQQLESVRHGLPRRYFAKLPRLRDEPLAGLPRIYGLAWAWVAHSDSGLDEDLLELFLAAYQGEQELALGELWALPTTLRVVLVENLRRLAERAATVQAARDAAHRWVDKPPAPDDAVLLDRIGEALQARGVVEPFALQLQRRAGELEPASAALARDWLAHHLSDVAGALQRQQQQEAEDHQSVRNAVTALRGLDQADWRRVLLRSCAALAALQQLPVFAAESEYTQDLTLHDIERLARRAAVPESRISTVLAGLAGSAAPDRPEAAPQHWLRGPGELTLLRALGLSGLGAVARRRLRRLATPAYLGLLLAASLGLVALMLGQVAPGVTGWMFALTALLLLGPASEAVLAVLHRLISESLPPPYLPRLALDAGIPAARRVLVVMPVMLTKAAAVQAMAAQLEQHHLSNPERHAQFALLSDDIDAPSPSLPGDAALLVLAQSAIEQLNRRHPPPEGEAPRFLLLHRARRWSDSEQCWIGWERKRGKLEALIGWLAADASAEPASPFVDLGPLSTPVRPVRSVLTLDSDTDMPPGRLRELVAIAAHPLNLPRLDGAARRVVGGYGILQPRVVVPLPRPGSVTAYHWLFSGRWGVDPYSAAASEVYQDLFDEGSFTGKGLLDVAAVHATLGGRLPDGQVLSHDLLEGALARCAAVSDVTLVEDVPAHPDVAASRLHRWMRGDWQLLPFILQPRRWPMAGINRWKMVDNLRRSLVAPASLALLLWVLATGTLPLGGVLLLVAAAYAAGPLLGAVAGLAPPRDDIGLALFFGHAGIAFLRALAGAAWLLLLLPAQAVVSVDAVLRALYRQWVSRRLLLQWTTAASAQAAARTDLLPLLRRHRATVLVALLPLPALLWLGAPMGWTLALGLAWAAAPLWIWAASRTLAGSGQQLTAAESDQVFELAIDTWGFYARYVGEADHHLPPDNVQFSGPAPMVAHRTSPTNIGLYLLAAAAARELGFIGPAALVERLEQTFATLDRLPRWRGHFFNWYDTQRLVTLQPAYVSAVDSGNLSGHLLVLAAACEALAAQGDRGAAQRLALAASARRTGPLASVLARSPALMAMAAQAEADPGTPEAPAQRLQLAAARRELDELLSGQALASSPGGVPGTADRALHRLDMHLQLLDQLLNAAPDDAPGLTERLHVLAERARAMALAADFGALYDPKRRLLHIGWDVDHERPDAGHYDLLASEARLASLVAIAKGDVPPRHWAALGRPVFAGNSVGGGLAVGMKSWSGSMFEYLMPSLVLGEPMGSLLQQATHTAVAAQRRDAAARGRPWGVSESAIAVQDHTLAYQYGPQGVASLALRRTPPDEQVVAPYASAMALMVAPRAAVANLALLQRLGARQGLGYIEALDYTAFRQPPSVSGATGAAGAAAGQGFTPVVTFMAHHQAMSLLACTHVLTGGAVHRWAAASPHVRAVLPLLHEPAPHVAPPLRQGLALPLQPLRAGQRWQHDSGPHQEALPPTHLLGNDRHALALSAGGGGWSQWQGQGLGRWRDDVLQAGHGVFAWLRGDSDLHWQALAAQPAAAWAGAASAQAPSYHSEFHPDRVLLHARWRDLTATTTVAVSTADDCELRQVELHNPGARPMRLVLAMAFEPTLTTHRADEAHPAFSNLFVQACWSPTERAMFMQRRPRLAHEQTMHAVHFLAACDDPGAQVNACADRSRWLGRLGRPGDPLLLDGKGSDRPGEGDEQVLDTGLDPVSVITVSLTVPPRSQRSLCFVLAASADEEALRALVDRWQQPASAARSLAMSDTLARIRLRELRLDPESWVAWLHLNTLLVNSLARPQAAPPEAIDRRWLWRHGIGGDRPILALWVTGPEGLDLARQLCSMLSLWTSAGLALDLVIVNDEPASYLAPVQQAFTALAEQVAMRIDPQLPAERRAVLKLLNARDLPPPEVATLRLLARLTLHTDGRSLAHHLDRVRSAHADELAERRRVPHQRLAWPRPASTVPAPEGRFEPVDAAFRFALTPTVWPLRPWVNVLANPDFGSLVSEAGGGFTWAGNSRLHQVTAGSNDVLCDPPCEALWLEDLDRGQAWWLGRGAGEGISACEVVHGIGRTLLRQVVDGLTVELSWCVDVQRAVKQLQLTVGVPPGGRRRHLRLVGFAEWTLGAARGERASLVTRAWQSPTVAGARPAEPGVLALLATQRDAGTGALAGSGGDTAFLCWRAADAGRPRGRAEAADWTCDRREFFDEGGRWVLPARLRGRAGAGLDACAAIGLRLDVSAGRPAQATLLLGHADSPEAAEQLALQACAEVPAERLAQQLAQWPALIGSIQVETPDPLFDALVNHWLPYQAIACRLWARAGFYQAGGAFGFRDQLQDAMNLADRAPQLLQQQLRVHAARQFAEGDVQHWWHPASGAGVRTHISDDLLWLPFALAHAVRSSGTTAVLDELVPFLHGKPVPADREDLYEVAHAGDEVASLFEHGARAIDEALRRGMGTHGLPLMGTGDWNDGMNRIGFQGRGESVWLGWFLCSVIDAYAPLAEARGERDRAVAWRNARSAVVAALDREGWDGEWYRRAFFDDGAPLGSHDNAECRIDLIAQAWAVLSAAGEPARAAQAMASAEALLWDPANQLMRLLDPPLAEARPDAGYVQAYPPGIRENGGQYNHGAVWALMALARRGDGAGAWRAFKGISPAHRSADPALGAAYAIEPYVAAGDIYSQPPFAGRGGWSWYSGSASWLQRAAVESICGLVTEGRCLWLDPCLPPHWPRVDLRLVRGGRRLQVSVLRDAALLLDKELAGAARRLQPGERVDWTVLADGARLVLVLPAASQGPSRTPPQPQSLSTADAA